MPEGGYRIEGLDTFEDERYVIRDAKTGDPVERPTEQEILEVAKKQLALIRKQQPDDHTGGQDDEFSIQDQLYVIRPDGTEYRFFDEQQADAYAD